MRTETAHQACLARMLVEAREQAGLSLQEISVALNLPLYSLKDLENGDFDKLHGEVFVVNYLKAYSELVGLDSSNVVGQYKLEKTVGRQVIEADPEFKPVESVFAALSSSVQHQKNRTGMGLLIAAGVTAIGFMLVPSEQVDLSASAEFKQEPAIIVETAVGTTTIETLDLLPAENPTETLIPKYQTAKTHTTALDHKTRVAKTVFAEDYANLSEQTILGSTLSFQFSADCWVEVYDGDNQRIFASLKKSQEILQLEGKPPFRITLGYAPGVSLSYNGQPVEIDANDRSHLTKLVLGNS